MLYPLSYGGGASADDSAWAPCLATILRRSTVIEYLTAIRSQPSTA